MIRKNGLLIFSLILAGSLNFLTSEASAQANKEYDVCAQFINGANRLQTRINRVSKNLEKVYTKANNTMSKRTARCESEKVREGKRSACREKASRENAVTERKRDLNVQRISNTLARLGKFRQDRMDRYSRCTTKAPLG